MIKDAGGGVNRGGAEKPGPSVPLGAAGAARATSAVSGGLRRPGIWYTGGASEAEARPFTGEVFRCSAPWPFSSPSFY